MLHFTSCLLEVGQQAWYTRCRCCRHRCTAAAALPHLPLRWSKASATPAAALPLCCPPRCHRLCHRAAVFAVTLPLPPPLLHCCLRRHAKAKLTPAPRCRCAACRAAAAAAALPPPPPPPPCCRRLHRCTEAKLQPPLCCRRAACCATAASTSAAVPPPQQRCCCCHCYRCASATAAALNQSCRHCRTAAALPTALPPPPLLPYRCRSRTATTATSALLPPLLC
jgi:hypothetical protein